MGRNDSRRTSRRRRSGRRVDAVQSDRLWGRLVQAVKRQDDAPAVNGSAPVEDGDVESIETLRRTVAELQHEVQDLRQRLEDRKVIERAKGMIMQDHGLSEDQAYRVLRETSMNSNQPMARVAKAVILAHKTGRVGPVRRRAAGATT